MFVPNVAGFKELREAVNAACSVLDEGVHYGAMPGTERTGAPRPGERAEKPRMVLFKPGAECLCQLFELVPSFETVLATEDITGEKHGGEPFISYRERCELRRNGELVATADGSANSWEKKHRYRGGSRVCPDCGQGTIKRSKKENPDGTFGWYCFGKIGGCGKNFLADDEAITGQVEGKTLNPEIADVMNTLIKIAQKRALVAATLIATGTSGTFTQDMEDSHESVAPPPPPRQNQSRQQGGGNAGRQQNYAPTPPPPPPRQNQSRQQGGGNAGRQQNYAPTPPPAPPTPPTLPPAPPPKPVPVEGGMTAEQLAEAKALATELYGEDGGARLFEMAKAAELKSYGEMVSSPVGSVAAQKIIDELHEALVKVSEAEAEMMAAAMSDVAGEGSDPFADEEVA